MQLHHFIVKLNFCHLTLSLLFSFSRANHSQQCGCMSHQGPLEVPAGCLLSGLELTASQRLDQLTLTSDIILQGHRVELGDMKLMVYTVMGAKDAVQVRSPFLTQYLLLFQLSTFPQLYNHLTVILCCGGASDPCDSFCCDCSQTNLDMDEFSPDISRKNSMKLDFKAVSSFPLKAV